MSNTKPGMFDKWKIIGLAIAVAVLVYRVITAAVYFDDINEYWAGLAFLFWGAFITSFATIATTFTRGKVTLIMSIVMMSLSFFLLFMDLLFFLGSIVSLSSQSMSEQGLFPLVHLFNGFASICHFISFFAIRKRDRKRAV